ncbi:MAG: hypothetical protein CUN55_01900 [Phototrophicales bacterium]|nr:MAG: hypothetical protein CUN55_01900 [Phototrophicales bacterium]
MLHTLLDNIRAVTDSHLIWLLTVQDEVLVDTVISAPSPKLIKSFAAQIERVFSQRIVPLQHAHNPIAEVLLRNIPLVGLEAEKLRNTEGGASLAQVLEAIDARYISLLPLRNDKNLLGVLLLANKDVDFISSERGQQLMKLIRRQITVELDYLQHFKTAFEAHQRALETQTKRLKTLNQASRAINSPIGLQDVIQVVLSLAYEVVQAEAAVLLLRDDDDDLIVVATHKVSDMHGRAITMGMGLLGWVAEHREPILVQNVEQDTRYRSYVDGSSEIQTQAMIIVPLATMTDVIGVLAVMNRLEGEFTQDDLETLENLGATAAIAIENATLFEQTQRRLTELSTMLDASAIATSTVELQSIVEPIARRLTHALDLQRMSIILLDGDVMRRLVSVVSASWPIEKALSIPLARLPSKAQALEIPNTVSLETSQLSLEEQTELCLRGMRHAVNVPLVLHGSTKGIITVYSNQEFEHSTPTVILEAVADWEKTTSVPEEEFMQLCQKILDASRSLWCVIYLLNDEQDELLLYREMGSVYHKPNSGIAIDLKWFPTAQKVMQSGEILPTTVEVPANKHERNYLRFLGLTDVLFAPILRQGVGVGVVELGIIDERPFDASAVSLSRGIANIIGNAIESYRLYSSLEQRASALEAAYRELEDADRLKEELLQNMAHELGTPLTHILGYLSLLADGAFGDLTPEQRETVDLAVRKTQHVANMIKQMVVGHASDSTILNLRDVHLDQLAALVVRDLELQARNMGIAIKPRISRNLPKVRVDPAAIKQVFQALLDNAIKFSGDGKLIEVEIRDLGGPTLQVAIHDKGIGISPEEQERVFRQFYQVDGSMTRRFGGLGLGLSVAKKIVEAHGGKIWLESELGKGTTVYFTVLKAIPGTALDATAPLLAIN